MKEIKAYQSDDGKFTGTYEQVENYEQAQEFNIIAGITGSCSDYIINSVDYDDFKTYFLDDSRVQDFLGKYYGVEIK